ncbi:putative aspartyl/asparaginy/proline hydroxylase, isopenicillin N synthase [Plasmopara halstedii]
MADDLQDIERKLGEVVQSWGISAFSERIALQWIKRFMGSDTSCDALKHLRMWIVLQLNHRRVPDDCSSWQLGCPEMIPQLRASPLWKCSEFSWVKTLENSFFVIKEELLALKRRPTSGFQPYRAPSWASDIKAKDGLGGAGHDAGDWNVFYLFLHNMNFQANRDLCPKTSALLESIDGHYNHAFFSALAPQTHIRKHHGPTNKKLRCHLPLLVPEGNCRLRVGDQVVYAQEGKCYIFDDSFEHEAWNDDDTDSRIVLIFDVWHPDLSAQEVKFFSFLRNARLRMEKTICEESSDNFYSIIKKATDTYAALPGVVWN